MNASKKVLVTGGTGFIGSHTVVELDLAGYEPVILDNYCNSLPEVADQIAKITGKQFPVIQADCRDTAAMRKALNEHGPFHSVIHFAAYKAVGESVDHPVMYYDNNIGSLVSLLDAMADCGMPGLVFSSSCAVYSQADELPVTEASPTKMPTSPYGYTKQVCETLIENSVASGSKLRAVTLRYFNPIGAHESSLIGELPIGKPNNLVPFITQTAIGLREKLTVFGNDYPTKDGSCVRDYIHVVDLARAHVKALNVIDNTPAEGGNHIANVGTGSGHSVLEIVQAFEKATGKKLNYEFGPRRIGDVAEVWGTSIDSHRLPDWEPVMSIETALKDAWNWQLELAKAEAKK